MHTPRLWDPEIMKTHLQMPEPVTYNGQTRSTDLFR